MRLAALRLDALRHDLWAACLAALLTACVPPVQRKATPDAAASPDTATADTTSATPPCRSPVTAPQWYHHAVGYEIYVGSFQDSDGDGVGDFKGLLSRLDHLNDGKPGGSDLGVDLLWLMPIYPSPSYHGYDVTDYRGIQPKYGTMQDFDALLAACHARGIRVVLDLVINHTSSQHPWFLASAQGTDKADWYVWRDELPAGWKQPWGGGGKVWHAKDKRWYYGVFWSGMPDLDVSKPGPTAEMKDVAAFWLGKGVDGFRLDAVRYLIETGPADSTRGGAGQADTPATLAWWQGFSQHVRTVKPDAWLVGEAWATDAIAAKYQTEGGLHATFDFGVAEAIVQGIQGGETERLGKELCDDDSNLPPTAPTSPSRGTFLTNHDQIRVGAHLKTWPERKLAAALLLFLPGIPFLYYGEEVGMVGGPTQADEDKRTPMQWDATDGAGFTTGQPWRPPGEDLATANVAAQTGDPQSLLATYRQLIGLRKQHAALRTGSLRVLPGGAGLWLGLREQAGQRVLGVFNLSEQPVTVAPVALDGLGQGQAVTDLVTGQALAVSKGKVEVGTLPGHGFRWLLVP